jgi:hypothetical protein
MHGIIANVKTTEPTTKQSTMKRKHHNAGQTPKTHSMEFRSALLHLGMEHARWHTETAPQYDAKNKDGHTIMRVCIEREGELQPHTISIYTFDGTKAQLCDGPGATIPATMPTKAILALITETLAAR